MGRRRYVTDDTSRNSLLIAITTLGEGWHNNHHYYQASARNGFFWWEIDVTYYVPQGAQLGRPRARPQGAQRRDAGRQPGEGRQLRHRHVQGATGPGPRPRWPTPTPTSGSKVADSRVHAAECAGASKRRGHRAGHRGRARWCSTSSCRRSLASAEELALHHPPRQPRARTARRLRAAGCRRLDRACADGYVRPHGRPRPITRQRRRYDGAQGAVAARRRLDQGIEVLGRLVPLSRRISRLVGAYVVVVGRCRRRHDRRRPAVALLAGVVDRRARPPGPRRGAARPGGDALALPPGPGRGAADPRPGWRPCPTWPVTTAPSSPAWCVTPRCRRGRAAADLAARPTSGAPVACCWPPTTTCRATAPCSPS